MTSSAGFFIAFEGGEGAGKSTQVKALAARLAAAGREVVLTREPGGTTIGAAIRALLLDPASHDMAPMTEALLYAAARAQLCEELLAPLLRAGTLVLLDRFVDSSLAYQGAGRALGIEAVRAVNAFATGPLIAERTLLLRIDPALGRSRQRDRAESPDRLEREHEDFFATIAAAYDELARAEPERIRVIDADQPPGQVLSDAVAALADLLPGGSQPG